MIPIDPNNHTERKIINYEWILLSRACFPC